MSFLNKYIIFGIVVLCLTAGANAEVLFQDNFDSYAALGTALTIHDASNGVWDTSPWGTGATLSDVKVGSKWPGVAYYSNNYWGDQNIHNARVTTFAGLTDCKVTVDALPKAKDATTFYSLEWYAMCRISGDTFVACGVICGSAGTDGTIPLYVRIIDSTGVSSGDYWVGNYDANYPVTIELKAVGSSLTGIVTHKAYTKTLVKSTTITTAGAPGFGGVYKWDYAIGYFDNFKLESAAPECGDAGTVYLNSDLNKDCYVNMTDIAMMVESWLNCTTPGNTNCEQY